MISDSDRSEGRRPRTEAGKRLNAETWNDAVDNLPADRSVLNFQNAGDWIADIEEQAVAAYKVELAEKVRALPGYIENRGAGALVEYVVLRSVVYTLINPAPSEGGEGR